MSSENIVALVENILSGDIEVIPGLSQLKKLKDEEGNKINCAIRLIKSFDSQSFYDAASHLRQFIIFYGYPVRVQNRVFYKFLENKYNLFGLTMIGENGNVKFSANPKILKNTKLETIYKYEKRAIDDFAIGDGRLYNYTGYTTYRSFSQKLLLNKISNMPFGDTLLACLPTGAGKSLSWQLPGIANEYSGLIIVIVPTIALAINHEEASKVMFNNVNSNLVKPKAYYSDCPRSKKEQIKEEILSGILPILYISPEALMQKEFKEMIIEAAKLNKVSMLVVDEAHLIVDWGARFRPEFQLIPSFRNSLNSTGNKIKTLLLSATLTENDTDIIKSIFDDGNNFIEFRADALRPEISYKLEFFENLSHRISSLKKLVLEAPKPMIIYSSTVAFARSLFEIVKETGLKNVSLFTGETRNEERKKIMEAWATDDTDIIVATSAFGMGVDKSDIRTIVHTFMPENISRFYQESGRAGRDGYAALDFCIIVSDEDEKVARGLMSKAISTTDNIVKRWFDLKNNSEIIEGDCMWIDTYTTPKHLLKSITGEQNADWNRGVILFLYRNHFIDILDVNQNGEEFLIKVKILKFKELQDENLMKQAINDYRDLERCKIDLELATINELFKLKQCFGSMFKQQYQHAEEICSGCPYCDKQNTASYYNRSTLKVFSKKIIRPIENLELSSIIKNNKESVLICDSYKFNYESLINYIVEMGIYNIVIPGLNYNRMNDIFNSLKFYKNINSFMLLNKDEFLNNDISSLLSGPIAVLLDDDVNFNNKVFKFASKYEKKNLNNILFISKETVIDPRFNKEILNTDKFPLGKMEKLIGG